jgi:ferredoxin
VAAVEETVRSPVNHGGEAMELSLQQGRCEGYGLCEEAAPNVYRLPDDSDVELLHTTVPEELTAEAAAGARACPVAAIKLNR